MHKPFFTIGHSTRSMEEFVQLARQADIELVVDVRSMPRSRRTPQFNADALPVALEGFGIDYAHISELGGRRSRSRDVPAETNALWRNDSFHNYADHALTDAFRAGLAQLRMLGHARTCACMCAEAVWWRCHRRIIADHLIAGGETVFHILAPSRIEPAKLTPGALVGTSGRVTYPAGDRLDAG